MRARPAITSSARAAPGAVVLCLVLGLAGLAAAGGNGDALATGDPRALEAAVTAIEHERAADPDTLYAAGRACEDKLLDPARALVLYDRVQREHPDAAVALSAARRGGRLRAQIGNGHAREATELAHLIAEADGLTLAEAIRRGDALGQAAWPGAAEATLWLAEWLRRSAIATHEHTRFDEADARYARVLATWPGSPEARLAATGRAGAAIDAHAWTRAEALIDALPVPPAAATDDTSREDLRVREDLRHALARGKVRGRLYLVAWLGVGLAALLLIASLVEAALRGGARRPTLRPPLEIWFLGPVALVLAIASFTANQAIAPAVLRIAITGIALAWLSGATLDLLRARGRPWRARAIAHVVLCAIGVVAIGYIAVTGGGLLDMLAETVRFGPDV